MSAFVDFWYSGFMLLTPRPFHIATRGRRGGQYGVATRGYIVLPDIVPRVPASADMAPADLWGRAESSPYGAGWIAEPIIQGNVSGLDYDGFLRQFVWEAVLQSREQAATVQASSMVAKVESEGEKTAEVVECPEPTAVVESADDYQAEIESSESCAVGSVADARDKKGCM